MRAASWSALRRVAILLGVFAAAFVAGQLGTWLHAPLAWMIGPMITTAAITLLFSQRAPPALLRVIGQLVIGGALGLHLTPDAFDRIIANAVPIIAGALILTAAATAYGVAQSRLFGVHRATALYSTVPGGPIEMALLATQNGGDGARTALAQTLRIVFVVLVFPPALTIAAVSAPAVAIAAGGWWDTALLAAIALAAGLAASMVRLTSPFFLGPMMVVGALAASGIPHATHHAGVVPAAQILLGVSPGSMFRRDLFRGAGRFLLGTCLSTAFLIAVSAMVSLILGYLYDIDLATMMLANAPGAVTEMVITAEVLRLDVATVASFQFVRIAIALTLVGVIDRFLKQHRPA
ncbi:AbrB family transcriptional regulator [Hoeflea sp. G2-23]|uniref:AbrB family transcriptional regulator n=1 Tax=Hoeflea algicola TaxID=2983763 RepID=A0ABT3ZF08_9HYPH|nr:AbrB family transcriptional regulator [Hoeflea algicola]MCY0150387.1 AbrB family transcriptional regulator [Hoeflea algicola]